MDFLHGLNPQQRRAVEAPDGPALVLAGPGSGKTRVLTQRVAYLVEGRGISPRHILAVTFTNKAAREMRERLEKILSPTRAAELTLGTFHSICARWLRRDAPEIGLNREFVIYDQDDQTSLIKQALKDLNVDEKRYTPSAVLNAISSAKNELITPENYQPPTYWHEMVRRVYPRYQELLRASNALDFDDLLLEVVRLLDTKPDVLKRYQDRYQYFLVDEFQDTNTAQYTMLQQLSNKTHNLFCVGDEDQCLPTGTLIQTPTGSKPIEKIREGEQVIAASGRGASMPSKVTHVGSRAFNGEVVRVTTRRGYSFRATPNHIVFTRLGISADVHCVYLMYRKELGYRIGLTIGARSDGVKPELQTGLKVRGNQEQADRVWILRVCSTREEASYWEAYYAFQYGIPTTVFHAAGRKMRFSQKSIERLFGSVDTIERAEQLLADLRLDERYPHYIPKAKLARHVVNLRYFSDSRRTETTPWTAHRVSINNDDQKLGRTLAARGYVTRKGKRKTWRFEASRLQFDDAQTLAQEVSQAGGDLEIITGAFLCAAPNEMTARRFSLMPVSHLHLSMRVTIYDKGKIVEDEIIEVKWEPYRGKVYDLEVADVHNYLAEGVVVHNSIYKWRGADFRNIQRFRDEHPKLFEVVLEQNYRSTQTILDAARGVIDRNVHRTKKSLFTERAGGSPITVYEAYNQDDEAEFVIGTIQDLIRSSDHHLGDVAVFYRTNAQSRAIEDAFIRSGIPYRLIGGTRFYSRREVKDVLAYLRLIHNPHDVVSLLRVINVPPRGIGAKTLSVLDEVARRGDQSAYQLIHALKAAGVNSPLASDLTPKAKQALVDFAALIDRFIDSPARGNNVAQLIDLVLSESGYLRFVNDGTEEGKDRYDNIKELRNVASDYTRAVGEDPLAEFLEDVALVADVDSLKDQADAPTLMTLHSAKGLEFPIVFITGLEEGLLPHSRSLEDPDQLEEERRLCYVGITRAKERVLLTYAFRRTMWGSNDVSMPSRFLSDIPKKLISGSTSFAGGKPKEAAAVRASTWESASSNASRRSVEPARVLLFRAGQRVKHAKFGEGIVIESKPDGSDEEVTVAFAKAGIKRLLASFANLTKLPG
jgi:DNA helicase-2/ATP-dependent DNA helicase PcrA